MELTTVFEKVPEGYIAFVEELPGANTQGASLEEARANLKEAVRLLLGIELLFDALNERAARAFAGRELTDQPDPNDPNEAKYLPSTCQLFGNGRTAPGNFLNLERETRLELATCTLARYRSTN